MSNLKCPFCKEEVISDLCFLFDKKTRDYTNGRQIYKCNKCGWFGNKELWQELMRVRKALDAAVDELEKMTWGCNSSDAEHLLKEIKAITAEQKDVK